MFQQAEIVIVFCLALRNRYFLRFVIILRVIVIFEDQALDPFQSKVSYKIGN